MNKKSPEKKWFTRLLFKGALALLLLLLAIFLFLKIITRHNLELAVPDLSGLTIKEAEDKAEKEDLRIEITDSIFISGMQRGIVLRQNPAAGNMVKKNRRILLTINTLAPKMVNMPSVTGYSLRQAKAELSARGLFVGRLNYQPDMATNNVLSQRYKGNYISPGTAVESGSNIDLEVGNSGDISTFIPDLKGMPLNIAKDILIDNYLNTGRIYFDNTIKSYSDSISGFVYRQIPAPTQEAVFPLGTRVELHITAERDKSAIKTKE